MRRTWIASLKSNNLRSFGVEVFFVLAIEKSDQNMSYIFEEDKIYSDLLILDLVDFYKMHTIKTVALMEYFYEECILVQNISEEEYIYKSRPVLLKTTDDIILFEYGLIRTILRLMSGNEKKILWRVDFQARMRYNTQRVVGTCFPHMPP